MKTLANCTPVEFLRQTNKIRHVAAKLLHDAGVSEIRKRMPVLDGTETAKEKREKIQEQSMKNLDAILDTLLEDYAEDTAALLGLMCFMDADEAAKTDMCTLLTPAIELFQNQQVRTFFSSLIN